MINKQTSVTYKLSLDDVKSAILMYLKSHGENLKDISIDPQFVTETYPLGIYDCGHIQIFNGIEVTSK